MFHKFLDASTATDDESASHVDGKSDPHNQFLNFETNESVLKLMQEWRNLRSGTQPQHVNNEQRKRNLEIQFD